MDNKEGILVKIIYKYNLSKLCDKLYLRVSYNIIIKLLNTTLEIIEK